MSMKFDEISRWSEIKIDIIEQYAIPYMNIMRNNRFKAHYIDGFSGAGIHISKKSGDIVKGSPLRVLTIPKPFDTYHFIDMGIVDLIINFPLMDINRNAIRKNLAKTSQDGIERMNSFWGDETWREIAYRDSQQQELFGSPQKEKQTNETIAEEFRKRLKEKGKFAYVPKPIPLRNSKNAVVYYLYFASQNKTANKIATYLFKKYGKET